MRIVHITNHFLPSPGGVEWSVLRTAEAQSGQGNQVAVVTETPAAAWEDSDLPFTVHRFSVPVIRPFTRVLYWREMWRLRALFRDADVLHFHDYTTFVHWYLPLRFIIRAPRYAVTFHGFEGWPVRSRHQLLRSLTARLCDARFAVGSYVERLYRHPVDAVYLGAPIRTLPLLKRADELRFVYAGRLSDDTLILPTLQALAAAAVGTKTHVHVAAAGEGALKETLQSLANTYCSVILHGPVDNTLPLMEDARFVIATGFLGILEAFQTGVPVVIPAFSAVKRMYVDSLPEIDSMATVLRDEGDAERMLGDLISGMTEDALLRRAARARLFVSEQSWHDISAMLEQWYTDPDAMRRSIQRNAERRTT